MKLRLYLPLLLFALLVTAALPAAAQQEDDGQAPAPGTDPAQHQRRSPIVGGKQLQPRPSELPRPDVPSSQGKELDDLYEQLMRESAPPGGGTATITGRPSSGGAGTDGGTSGRATTPARRPTRPHPVPPATPPAARP